MYVKSLVRSGQGFFSKLLRSLLNLRWMRRKCEWKLPLLRPHFRALCTKVQSYSVGSCGAYEKIAV